MAKVQMNVRVDEETKRVGDKVFAEVGYNPTQVVDLVWRFAAANMRNPRRVKAMLDEYADKLGSDEADRRERAERAIAKSHALIEWGRQQMISLGMPPDTVMPELSNEEMRELAYEDRAREKGWL